MPFCPSCGKEVSPETTFCPNCGFNIQGIQKVPAKVQSAVQQQPKKSHLRRNVALGITFALVFLIAIAAAAGALLSSIGSNTQSSLATSSSSSSPTATDLSSLSFVSATYVTSYGGTGSCSIFKNLTATCGQEINDGLTQTITVEVYNGGSSTIQYRFFANSTDYLNVYLSGARACLASNPSLPFCTISPNSTQSWVFRFTAAQGWFGACYNCLLKVWISE